MVVTPFKRKSLHVVFFACFLLLQTVYNEELSCSFNYAQNSYSKGDPFMICLNYLPFLVKSNIFLTVGDNMVIHQKYMYRVFEKFDTDMILQVANSNIYTSGVPYNRPKNKLVFPFRPVIITLDKGKIIDISLIQMDDICGTRVTKINILKSFYKHRKYSFMILTFI